jgi:hypothetical protein
MDTNSRFIREYLRIIVKNKSSRTVVSTNGRDISPITMLHGIKNINQNVSYMISIQWYVAEFKKIVTNVCPVSTFFLDFFESGDIS